MSGDYLLTKAHPPSTPLPGSIYLSLPVMSSQSSVLASDMRADSKIDSYYVTANGRNAHKNAVLKINRCNSGEDQMPPNGVWGEEEKINHPNPVIP